MRSRRQGPRGASASDARAGGCGRARTIPRRSCLGRAAGATARATATLSQRHEGAAVRGKPTTCGEAEASGAPIEADITIVLDESRNPGEADLALLLLAVGEVVSDEDVRLRDGRQ